MSPKPREKHAEGHQAESRRTTDRSSRTECLDTEGLRRLEESFRRWVEEASAHRTARLRIFLIFLLIRHTGAKLNEVLRLNPFEDIDWENRCVLLRSGSNRQGSPGRLVDISRHGLQDIRALVEDPGVQGHVKGSLLLDAAFVRRKFYERAQACGYASHLGGPEMIRSSRHGTSQRPYSLAGRAKNSWDDRFQSAFALSVLFRQRHSPCDETFS